MIDRDTPRFSAVADQGPAEIRLEGSPTVLVVDDEELMREMASIMLEENGAKVLTAADGDEAVALFASGHERIDFVFMDYSMPRMNGYAAAVEMRRIKPTVKIVMVSGLGIVPEVEALYRKGEIEFMSKPFHEAELIKTLRRLQDGA